MEGRDTMTGTSSAEKFSAIDELLRQETLDRTKLADEFSKLKTEMRRLSQDSIAYQDAKSLLEDKDTCGEADSSLAWNFWFFAVTHYRCYEPGRQLLRTLDVFPSHFLIKSQAIVMDDVRRRIKFAFEDPEHNLHMVWEKARAVSRQDCPQRELRTGLTCLAAICTFVPVTDELVKTAYQDLEKFWVGNMFDNQGFLHCLPDEMRKEAEIQNWLRLHQETQGIIVMDDAVQGYIGYTDWELEFMDKLDVLVKITTILYGLKRKDGLFEPPGSVGRLSAKEWGQSIAFVLEHKLDKKISIKDVKMAGNGEYTRVEITNELLEGLRELDLDLLKTLVKDIEYESFCYGEVFLKRNNEAIGI